MRFGSRLTLAFISVLVIIGAGAVIANWQFNAVVSDARRIIAVNKRLASVQQVENDIGVVSRHLASLVEQQQEARLLEETQSVRRSLAKHLRNAFQAFGESGLAPPRALSAATRSVYDELDAIDRLAQIGDWQAIRLRINMQLNQILSEIGDVVHQVADAAQRDRDAALRQVDARRNRARLILATSAILSLLVSLALGYYVTRSITRPLLALQRATHKLAERDFDLQLRTDTNDEVAEVGRDLLIAAGNLRASYSALERSNADLEHFAHAVSHDLREPLRTIRLLSQMLKRQNEGVLSPAASEQLAEIGNAALRMNQLIEGILAYSRLTHAEVHELEEVDMADVLQTVLQNLQVTIAESQAEIQVGPLPAIRADRVQMIQVLQNLIGNAIKYSRKEVKPLVHVSARQQSDRWIFSVKDNGIGIRPEHHERIFAPFQQIGGSRAGGVGLGLTTTKRMVEQQGGDIWVESDGANGSQFFFSVPSRIMEK